jgi:hypothetical protein
MGRHFAAGAQRVDLLDYLGQERGNAKGSCAKSGFRTDRGHAPTMLLDRVHSPDRQGDQPIGARRACQAIKVEIGGKNWVILFILLISIIKNKNMIKGNFLGAAIVAIMYTVFILINPLPKTQQVITLMILNALTIVLMYFAFK